MKLFITTVQYGRVQENGTTKAVKEQYLVDALTFTEAEARITLEMVSSDNGFEVLDITRPRLHEAFLDSGDAFYKAKVKYVTLDEKTGTEKATVTTWIVRADSFDEAYKTIKNTFKGGVSDASIVSLVETPIVDFIQTER